eukprot:6476025-Amphidinium_carterae.1
MREGVPEDVLSRPPHSLKFIPDTSPQGFYTIVSASLLLQHEPERRKQTVSRNTWIMNNAKSTLFAPDPSASPPPTT